MAVLELLTIKIKQMTIESTNDNIPTAPAITYSDCYRLPFLSLFHADCMDIMKQYPDKYFDLAIVDPPYGIDLGNNSDYFAYKGGIRGKKGLLMYRDWEKERPTDEYWNELFRVSKNQIVWGGNYFTDVLAVSDNWIVWKKMDMKCTYKPFELEPVSVAALCLLLR